MELRYNFLEFIFKWIDSVFDTIQQFQITSSQSLWTICLAVVGLSCFVCFNRWLRLLWIQGFVSFRSSLHGLPHSFMDAKQRLLLGLISLQLFGLSLPLPCETPLIFSAALKKLFPTVLVVPFVLRRLHLLLIYLIQMSLTLLFSVSSAPAFHSLVFSVFCCHLGFQFIDLLLQIVQFWLDIRPWFPIGWIGWVRTIFWILLVLSTFVHYCFLQGLKSLLQFFLYSSLQTYYFGVVSSWFRYLCFGCLILALMNFYCFFFFCFLGFDDLIQQLSWFIEIYLLFWSEFFIKNFISSCDWLLESLLLLGFLRFLCFSLCLLTFLIF